MSGIELFALPAVLGGGSVSLAGAIGAAGLAASTISSVRGAQFQAAGQRAQAAQVRQDGHLATIQGEAAAAKVADDGRRQRARVFNQLAGQGVDPQSGSGSELMDDLAAGSALDASIARWRGTQESASAARRASLTDWQAGAGLRTAWWREGGTLLTSGARLMSAR